MSDGAGTPPLARAQAWRDASARIPRLEARLLLEHVCAISHAELLTRPDTPLTPEEAAAYAALVARRAAGEPLAYLTGHAPFRGLDLTVTPDVLIPRDDTEVLVDRALQAIAAWQQGGARLSGQAAANPAPVLDLQAAPPSPPPDQPLQVLDLGTGSGAIALALAREAGPAVAVTAVDRSPAALAVAEGNARRLGLAVRFVLSDWFSALAGERFHLIAGNPPYVAEGDPHLEGDGLPFEPRGALTDGVAGGDGGACLRAIVAAALAHLHPGGWLLLEHGYDQGPLCRDLLAAAGFAQVATWTDLAGLDRVSGGIWAGGTRSAAA